MARKASNECFELTRKRIEIDCIGFCMTNFAKSDEHLRKSKKQKKKYEGDNNDYYSLLIRRATSI